MAYKSFVHFDIIDKLEIETDVNGKWILWIHHGGNHDLYPISLGDAMPLIEIEGCEIHAAAEEAEDLEADQPEITSWTMPDATRDRLTMLLKNGEYTVRQVGAFMGWTDYTVHTMISQLRKEIGEDKVISRRLSSDKRKAVYTLAS